MITRKTLELIEKTNYQWFKKHNPSCLPTPLFINNVFNPHNWNSGMAHLIRDFIDDLDEITNQTGIYTAEFDLDNDICGDIVVTKAVFNDQTYVSIVTMTPGDLEPVFDQYLITFYKRRGRTELITKNGKPITLGEYIQLLNIIEASGYKFKINYYLSYLKK